MSASPRQGEIGATIHLEGYGFTDAHWRDPEPSLWLAGGDPGCQVYAEARHTVRVTPDGRLHGDFLVPTVGACRQTGVTELALQSGTYAIVFQCTACTIGTFQVTGGPSPPSAECTTVGFTPQSEDAASSIVATGLSCEEAEAFLRRLGPSVSANGPPRIELDGFECVLTRHEPEPLPHGFSRVHERHQEDHLRPLVTGAAPAVRRGGLTTRAAGARCGGTVRPWISRSRRRPGPGPVPWCRRSSCRSMRSSGAPAHTSGSAAPLDHPGRRRGRRLLP